MGEFVRIRKLLGAALTAAALTVGLAPQASATQSVSYQDCLNTHKFTEFFRNYDPLDKYCYAPGGIRETVPVEMNNITWFHAGNNNGVVTYHTNQDPTTRYYWFAVGEDFGVNHWYVEEVRIFGS